ncbi:CRISPR-associated protein, Cse3 family [Syntrophus gentianae]|uniref:CRISPR-associated protein, Cse3 family n=1 Tax=Syntrophus gentianae TaxID=43775 RepID=A0A1H8AB79_9BACT|nr:type I-E CRISPR-associated protein Cas6/Cse3/CasE [Syntrophus gentianae]SEM66807.1 CRISPR-associated protein, Cse3 family [Syntrophus gentianae]
MYLSKILIKGPACRNPYEIHKVLWNLFPVDEAADRDFLFRVSHADRNRAEILMQSIREPERSSDKVQILACKDYPLLLIPGQRLRFLLLANPVKTIDDEAGRTKADGATKKCRVPLIREEEQRSWMERKFQHVASIETLVIDPVFPLIFRKSREGRIGKIQPVCFQGVLKVEEPVSMTELIEKGVGPAKAFGCGLLSLARA